MCTSESDGADAEPERLQLQRLQLQRLQLQLQRLQLVLALSRHEMLVSLPEDQQV